MKLQAKHRQSQKWMTMKGGRAVYEESDEESTRKRRIERLRQQGYTRQQAYRMTRLKSDEDRDKITTKNGTTVRVPAFKPPQQVNPNQDSVPEPVDPIPGSVQPPTQDEHPQQTQLVYTQDSNNAIRLIRKDKLPPSRADQFYIGAQVGLAQLKSKDKTAAQTHGTRLDLHCVVIYVVNPDKGLDYFKTYFNELVPSHKETLPGKQERSIHPGYQAFLPDEELPLYRLAGSIPDQFMNMFSPDQLTELMKFSLPTHLQDKRVTMYAQPIPEPKRRQHYRLFFDVDKEIWDYLKEKAWSSFIGGYLVTFEKPGGIRGVYGYIPPDAESTIIQSSQHNQQALATTSVWADKPSTSKLTDTPRRLPVPVREKAIDLIDFSDTLHGIRSPTPDKDNGDSTPPHSPTQSEDISENEAETLLNDEEESTPAPDIEERMKRKLERSNSLKKKPGKKPHPDDRS